MSSDHENAPLASNREPKRSAQKAREPGDSMAKLAADLRLSALTAKSIKAIFPSLKSRSSLTAEQRRGILTEVLPQGRSWSAFVLRFYTLLIVSVIIATVGLATNSASVVIGAMLIAPLMTPIMGLATALVLGWWRHQVRLILFIGAAGLLVIGLAYVILWLFHVPAEMPVPDQVLARTHPALGDLAVALCAGLAAAYMLVRRESLSALPGVAISVALVPPLCSAGILVYFGEPDLAWNAILLFLTNASAIVLAASAMFLFMRIRPKSQTPSLNRKVLSSNAIALTVVALIAIPLFHQTVKVFKGVQEQTKAVIAVRDWIINDAVSMQGLQVRGDQVTVDLLVNVPLGQFGPEDALTPRQWIPLEMPKEKLNQALNRSLGRELKLTLTGDFRFTN